MKKSSMLPGLLAWVFLIPVAGTDRGTPIAGEGQNHVVQIRSMHEHRASHTATLLPNG
jgi:hypothetical protein